nr:reverse transcriptase domain-containing protein [Tanacetum cinerariifolium]
MATNRNGDDEPPPNGGCDLLVPDLRTMEELCQPTLNGWGGPIAPIAIQATNFGLKNDMIQQVQNSCQFHGLPGNDANKHLDKFLHVTQSIKVNVVIDDALRLYLFPHSLTHHATAWFDRLPRNSITTFEKTAKMFLGKYFPPSMVTKLRNEITNFRQRPDESLFKAWERYKLSIDRCPNHNMKRRPEECYDLIENMTAHHNDWDTSVQRSSGTLPSNTITNPKEDLKGITTRSGIAYKGPTIPTTSFSPQVVKRETDVTKDMVPPTNNGSTKNVQPPVVQVEAQVPNFEPVVELVEAPVSAPKPNPKPSIPYPSRLHEQKLPRTLLNEHCSAVLLKKLPEKLGDSGKFLIPCNFLGMDECLALADLGASINLIPLSVWNKLSLPELSPTCMTLELVDRSISRPVGVVEDVFVKVGKFHFPVDFVVVDFDADPRVSLILKRSFLKTGRTLIDVYEGELTLRVGNKAVTFNLDQTSRYSANYDVESINRIDVMDVARKDYSQEILRFSVSGNPTPSTEPIVSTSSPTLTPFGDNGFLLEETDAFLLIDDEPISSEINDSYYDSEGDILLLEEFLNDDPSLPPLPP